jgi:hypothetical protein
LFSLGIVKDTSSLDSQSRVERFLNSPEAQNMQRAVELNAYMKLDPRAAERFDLIRALDIKAPSFDSGTVETTLKTILEKDLLNTRLKDLVQNDPKLLQKFLKLANLDSNPNNALNPNVQSLSASVINVLIDDKSQQEYLLNTDTIQKNLKNFMKIVSSSTSEGRLFAVADFLEGLSSQKGKLAENLDSFSRNLEKGQAGELGKQINLLFQQGNIANELVSFLAVPERYLGDSAETQSVMQASDGNKTIYERLSDLTQKIFVKECAPELSEDWQKLCTGLLSHDKIERQNAKEGFALKFHKAFEDSANLSIETKGLEARYKTLEGALGSDGKAVYLVNKKESEILFLAMLNHDSVNEIFSQIPSTVDNKGRVILTEKHLPLLRIAIEKNKLSLDNLEEKLAEDMAQIAKVNLSLKMPCGDGLGNGIGTLMLTRLLEEDDLRQTVFSKYRPTNIPDDATNPPEGTLHHFVKKLTTQSLQSESSLLNEIAVNLKTSNESKYSGNEISVTPNLHSELNSYMDLLNSSDSLVQDFETIALESPGAKVFLGTRKDYQMNSQKLASQINILENNLNQVHLSPPYLDVLKDPATNNSEIGLLNLYISIHEDFKDQPMPQGLGDLSKIIQERLELKKELGKSFIEMLNEEKQFQIDNGSSHPFNRLASILCHNIGSLDFLGVTDLPSNDDILELLTRLGSTDLGKLSLERKKNCLDFQNNMEKFNETDNLNHSPDLHHTLKYSEVRDLAMDQYRRCSQIISKVLLSTDEVINQQHKNSSAEEVKLADKYQSITTDEQGNVETNGGVLRQNYGLSKMIRDVVELLSESFQRLLRGLTEVDKSNQGVLVQYV